MHLPFLHDRRRALEEAFFAKTHTKLVERLRLEKELEERTAALSEASGIKDPDLLSHLVEIGLGTETVLALAIVPLIEVAWVDGKVQHRERKAVIKAARQSGIENGSPADELLSSWLENEPDPRLLESWKAFVETLSGELSDGARHALKADVMGRARRVAEAAGGILGLATVSGAEQDKLWELDRCFQ